MASRITRSVAVSVNDVLDGHVRLGLECLDRVCLHGYLGRLVAGLLILLYAQKLSVITALTARHVLHEDGRTPGFSRDASREAR